MSNPQRTNLQLDGLPTSDGFRMRGLSATRLDTFVDAAFAFGATVLLVSAGSLPEDYTALIALLKDIPSYVLSYATLMVFWVTHRLWSRRYGLENFATISCTLMLVLCVLVFIYPLKSVYTSVLHLATNGWLSTAINITSPSEGSTMVAIYGFGFAALSGCMMGLYAASWAKRGLLQLDAEECDSTRRRIAMWGLMLATGLVSAAGSLWLPEPVAVWAGMVYVVLGPGISFILRFGRERSAELVPS